MIGKMSRWVAGFFLIVCAGGQIGGTSVKQAKEACPVDVTSGAIVQIFVNKALFNWLEPYKTPDQEQGTGSGFFIDQDGYFLTNYHVVEQCRGGYIQIPPFGKKLFPMKVVGVCPEQDIALACIEPSAVEEIKKALGYFPVLLLGDSDKVVRDAPVRAVGFPRGLETIKSTEGTVSGLEMLSGSFDGYCNLFIQISAPTAQGSSGGPVFDDLGNVIGISTRKDVEVGNIGYAIPINNVVWMLSDLRSGGVICRPGVGMHCSKMTSEAACYLQTPNDIGIYIAKVFDRGIASQAGLCVGDVLVELNGYPIDFFGEVKVPWAQDKVFVGVLFDRLQWDQMIKMVFYRAGQRREVELAFKPIEPLMIVREFPEFKESIDYEVIGGMVVMNLMLNHVRIMLNDENTWPVRYRGDDLNQLKKSRVVLTHVIPDSPAARSRSVNDGMLVKRVNGQKVRTLEEFRAAVLHGASSGYISVECIRGFNTPSFMVLSVDDIIKREPELAETYHYPLTPFHHTLVALSKKSIDESLGAHAEQTEGSAQ